MTLPSDERHPFWGRQYPQYTNSYTNEALSTLLISPRDAQPLTIASETIDNIRRLSHSRAGVSVDHITLPMLTDLLDEIRDPGQLRFIAQPDLVSGCVSLIAAVKPSALQYEYGHVCFRILVISLNACIMKHNSCLEETIEHMNGAPVAERFATFWGASSWIVYQKSRGNEQPIPTDFLSEPVLDQLLKLLYLDEKLFLMVSKHTGSLGLSGLMSVLFTHLVDTEKRYIFRDDHFREIIRPFIRIFWRYLIVTPEAEAEEIAMFDLHARVSLYARLHDERSVDVEDSTNLVQALSDRLESSRPVSAVTVAAMLRFVAPQVVPGCEDLIPTIVKRCIEILWNSLSSGLDPAHVRQIVFNFLIYLRDMLMALKPPQFSHQPWVWEVVDYVIKGDVLDLALRAFSTVSSYNPGDIQGENASFTLSVNSITITTGTEGQLFSAIIEAYIAVSELAPVPDLMDRFFEAGCLRAWSKCYLYFRVSGTEPTYRDTFAPDHSVNWACGEIIAGVMAVLTGSASEDFLAPFVGSCDNPRCAMPCYALLICSECVDLIYCSLNCATTDWNHVWGGPHRKVCKQKAPNGRFYHQMMNVPLGFNDRTPSASENAFSRRLIDHIRGKWSRPPTASTLQGITFKEDYRNPMEFQEYKYIN
ncbi:unnamed protein product [Rhizoctonia solani]|uniref:MYND-type domain-containing protein n=1 Tax=Rhizoctonia solani TaxID=456999 RepID=A0A8H3E182_9AGAM|nr:unnamed protein product [Rhizoctonia solani]